MYRNENSNRFVSRDLESADGLGEGSTVEDLRHGQERLRHLRISGCDITLEVAHGF